MRSASLAAVKGPGPALKQELLQSIGFGGVTQTGLAPSPLLGFQAGGAEPLLPSGAQLGGGVGVEGCSGCQAGVWVGIDPRPGWFQSGVHWEGLAAG